MNRLMVRLIGSGMHPSESLVEISSQEGMEEMIVDTETITNESVEVSFPIAQRNGSGVLVELPRETVRGAWRVWVEKSQLRVG
jgi:hypothetical protein